MKRKTLCAILLGAATLVACAPQLHREQAGPTANRSLLQTQKNIALDVSDGTWIGVDVHPTGDHLLIDILGNLYKLPIMGGEAQSIRSEQSFDFGARYSPDGTKIAFASDNGNGIPDLFVMDATTRIPKQIADGPVNSIQWLSNYDLVVGSSFAGPVKRIKLDGDIVATETISDEPSADPFFNKRDGTLLYSGYQQMIFEPVPRVSVMYTRPGQETVGPFFEDELLRSRTKISPDGKWVVYIETHADGNRVYAQAFDRQTAPKLLAQSTLVHDRRPSYSDRSFHPDYAFSADSKKLYIDLGGGPHEIDLEHGTISKVPFRARIELTVRNRITPFQPSLIEHLFEPQFSSKVLLWPNYSANTNQVVFVALGSVWSHNTVTRDLENLGSDPMKFQFAPDIHDRTGAIAYVEIDERSGAHIYVLYPDGAEPVRITKRPGFYAAPVFSPSGKKLAFLYEPEESKPARGKERLSAVRRLRLAISDLKTGAERDLTDIQLVFAAGLTPPQVAVRFNDDETHIQFLTLINGRDRVLRSLDLKTLQLNDHLTVPRTVDRVDWSKDGKHLAFSNRTSVQIRSLADDVTIMQLNNSKWSEFLKLTSHSSQTLSGYGATYFEWATEECLLIAQKSELNCFNPNATEFVPVAKLDIQTDQHMPAGHVAFSNAKILTMHGEQIIENGTILVRQNQIQWVGPANEAQLPTGTVEFQLNGQIIMPGLVDTHYHTTQEDLVNFEYIDRSYRPYHAALNYGVTTVFDPSTDNITPRVRQELVSSGRMFGPRVFSTGSIVYGPAGFASSERVVSPLRATQIASFHQSLDHIMLKSYQIEDRLQRRRLVDAADQLGIGITAEGSGHTAFGLLTYLSFVMDGFTAIEHLFLRNRLYEDVAALIAATGVHTTPTLIVSSSKRRAHAYRCFAQYFSDDSSRYLVPDFSDVDFEVSVEDACDAFFAEDLMVTLDNLREIVAQGGVIDIGSHGSHGGMGTHIEMWAIKDIGLSNLEILQAATIKGAKKLGLVDALGTIETGKLADFVVLNSDPTDNILNSADLEYIVKNGVVYEPSPLREVYPRTQVEFEAWNAIK